MVRELTEACDRADTDPDVRVVVLTNVGSTFCAGANLSERSAVTEPPVASPQDLFSRFASSPKPYVGRIAGHCVAGGMGLAAAMDIAIADEAAKFGFTEVRVGVAPAMVSVVCLPRLRDVDARNAFLRGNRFTGREAARIGIVTDAVPRDRLDDAVQEVVDDLLLGSPSAIAASKRILSEVPKMAPADAVTWTARLSSELFESDEAKAGMDAFLARQPAPWAVLRP